MPTNVSEDADAEPLAENIAEFAMRRDLTDAHLLTPRNFVMRDLVACALEGIRETRRRDRR
jgi:hypothetical protein